jgi:hypothetical protein
MAICSCLGPRILLILRSKHTVDGNNKMSHLNIVHIINNKISYIFLHNYRRVMAKKCIHFATLELNINLNHWVLRQNSLKRPTVSQYRIPLAE